MPGQSTSNETVAIVIPNRDGAEFLGKCLDTMLRQSLKPIEIILVDDGSLDNSVAIAAKDFPAITLIRSTGERIAPGDTAPKGQPRGFAATCNAGMRATKADYIALINNDTEADPEWLAQMMMLIRVRPRAAGVTCRMLQRDGKTVNALCLSLHENGEPHAYGDGLPDSSALDKSIPVFGPSGGGALWRRSALDQIAFKRADGAVEYFDEDFFAYFEDADLAWRARAEGFDFHYAPGARMIHLEGSCPTLTRFDKSRVKFRNRVWFAFVNLPGQFWLKHLPQILWNIAGRQFFKYGLRPWKVEGRAFWDAARRILCDLPLLLRKRALRQSRRIPTGELPELWAGWKWHQ